jgi:hypothetical protein
MGVFFHILSTGGGSGGSRITRYIAERDKDLEREGLGSRRLFSDDQDNLSYHRADRILDPDHGRPEKDDLIHFSVMIQEEEFDKLGVDEKDKQTRFREAVREAMKGIAAELNADELTWVAGMHRNTQNPHAHVVMSKEFVERGSGRSRRIERIPKALLPHREIENGKEILVNGPIGEKFVVALEKQQALYDKSEERQPELTPAEIWERLANRFQKGREESGRSNKAHASEVVQDLDANREHVRENKSRSSGTAMSLAQISASWNPQQQIADDRFVNLRIALGKRLELECRLAFAEVWHDRAVNHGQTYRFEVVDQSIAEARRISELDVRRRAAARATRLGQGDLAVRNAMIEADLASHAETLRQLEEARQTKIDGLAKDAGSLLGNLSKVEQVLGRRYEISSEKSFTPLVSRQVLSELQNQAVRLNLPEKASELESVRVNLAREYAAPTRTDAEAPVLGGQLNVARADLMARDARLEKFEATVHLTSYEVGEERWSLAAIDKQISRRRDDSKLVPQRAARLDLSSLARLNYSAAGRSQAAADVEHLTNVRNEFVRQIEQRREPLVVDRDLAREMVDVLEIAHSAESRSRLQGGKTMPEPQYERYQINALESSAETLRDPNLLREVHDWEKMASRSDSEINWEGRAVAREITSHLAVEETRERLEHFLESKKVASLHVGEHRTGTLREVEARSLTEYSARTILETSEQRDHRHTVTLAAREHHDRLSSDYAKAHYYHEAARELASEAKERDPKFTDREKINLEIHAERQNDPRIREQYLEMALSQDRSQERDVAASQSR